MGKHFPVRERSGNELCIICFHESSFQFKNTKHFKNNGKNTRKVREFCQFEKVGTMEKHVLSPNAVFQKKKRFHAVYLNISQKFERLGSPLCAKNGIF